MFAEDETKAYTRVQCDSSVIHKRIIQEGAWGSKATENATVKIVINDVTCTGVPLQSLQESTAISQLLDPSFNGSFKVGDVDSVIDKSLETCVQSMLVGETSSFNIKLPSISNLKQEECSVFPYVIQCSIKLEDLTNDTPIYMWTIEKIHDLALKHKTEGVKLFNSGRKIESFLRFSKSFKILNIIKVTSEKNKDSEDFLSLRIALLNNMANCQLEFQNYIHAITLCSKVLILDPNNIKSLYRRSVAYMNIKKLDEAKDDLQKILQIEPCNAIAKEKYSDLKIIMKEKDANYAAVIKKMFSS
ncbi:FK506-binding protein 59 [Gryllus bimaculatus]|nr:FK506-binding protein 59 [Gryllus bimaculatus]